MSAVYLLKSGQQHLAKDRELLEIPRFGSDVLNIYNHRTSSQLYFFNMAIQEYIGAISA
jgi:hypothetical protein